jgi:hypothetical protein
MNGKVSYGPLDLDFKEKSLTYRLDPSKQMFLHPAEPPSYIIFQEDGLVKAKNGKTGQISFSGTDASTVIQSALNGLTPGRTWKEKVVLKGDFGQVHDIIIPSYTIVKGVDARLQLGASYGNLFKILAGSTDIKIAGITFQCVANDGEKEAIFAWGSGNPAINVKVSNCKFLDFVGSSGAPGGICGYYSHSTFKDNYCSSLNGSGNSYLIYLNGSKDVKICENTFISKFSGSMIYAGAVTTDVKIFGNDFEQPSDWTTNLIEAIDLEQCVRTKITNNAFRYLNIDGITGDTNSMTEIENNQFYYCGYQHTARRGAVSMTGRVGAENGLLISNNIMEYCNIGVRLGDYGQNEVVKAEILGNWMENCNYSFVFYGNAFNVRMLGNTFRNCTNTSYGAGVLYAKFNEGFVTENSGTATFSGTGAQTAFTIAHGLAGTPTTAVVTAGSSDAKGDFYVTYDATNITVTYATAPPAGTGNVALHWSASM